MRFEFIIKFSLIIINFICRIIRNFDPVELLKKEYNDKLRYNYFVSVAISQGHHESVTNFLEKVPSVEKQGNRGFHKNYFL